MNVQTPHPFGGARGGVVAPSPSNPRLAARPFIGFVVAGNNKGEEIPQRQPRAR